MGKGRVGDAIGCPRAVVIHLWDASGRVDQYGHGNRTRMAHTSRTVCNDALSVASQPRTSCTSASPSLVEGLRSHLLRSRRPRMEDSGPSPSGPGQLYRPYHSTTKYKARSH
jgi:hypothetical protein